MFKTLPRLTVASLIGLALSTLLVHAQGDLTPPGPPAPTFKTLQQVEPRIPVDAAHTPGDADSYYKITKPGSYYLTDNVNVLIRVGEAKQTAIEIASSDVVLDLGGFRVNGNGAKVSVHGVNVSSSYRNITVRNGVIRDCGYNGVNAGTAQACTFEKLALENNGTNGIVTGDHCAVRECLASNNGSMGISVGSYSTVTDSQARGNPKAGINATYWCVISRCTAADATSGDGIAAESYCVVDHCSVNNAYQWGIRTVQRANISDCTVANAGHVDQNGVSGGVVLHYAGILRHSSISSCRVGVEILGSSDGGGSVVQECEIDSNTGGGIDILSGGNRIDGNLIGYNAGPCIRTHEGGNIIVRNHFIGTAPSLGGNDMVGPTIKGTGTISGLANGSSPWANFQQ
jgi:hypothetical protein